MILITPGDPRGVGPEVTLAAVLRRVVPWEELTIVGDRAALPSGPWTSVAELGQPVPEGTVAVLDPGDEGEPVEVASVRLAAEACLAGRADALVTGPIHKAKLARRGFKHLGHTELLGEICGVERPVMAFVGGSLRVALVTVHVPLRQVPDAVTGDLVLHTVRIAAAALADPLRLPRRRLALCGLNPHAGDEGVLGREELDVIGPAADIARSEGLDVVGPVSAETAFLRATAGEVDMVIAMYHDQGLAPLKAVDFGRSVNWTLGLPIVRTSVDHGTACGIAGTGKADPSSMISALTLAADIVERRRSTEQK